METQTTIAGVVFNLVYFVASIIGFLGIVVVVPSLIVGIIFFVKSSSEIDVEKKKSYKKRGIIFSILPFVMIFGALIISVILGFLRVFLGVGVNY